LCHARGEARYESHHPRPEFEIHVAGIQGLAGRRLVVRGHGV
jgi:hypothetical protein